MLDTQLTIITPRGAGRSPQRPGRALQPIARQEVVRQQPRSSDFYAERASGWSGMLSTAFASIASQATYDLRARIQAVSTEAQDHLEEIDPGTTGTELKLWLDQRLAVELAHHQLGVLTAVRGFSARAAQYFALPGPVVIDPPRTRTTSDFDTARLAVHRKKNSRLSTSVNIGMRAYMGFMIFFVLTMVMGVHIPAVLGVLPVLFMGGVALYEEYRKRIEQRQHQASDAVAQHIGEFADRASHEMEDLVRALEIRVDSAYRSRVEPLL